MFPGVSNIKNTNVKYDIIYNVRFTAGYFYNLSKSRLNEVFLFF